MSLVDVQQRFLSMCLEGEVGDVGSLADPDEAARLLLYRDMVRWRFHQIAGDVLPRTKERLTAEVFRGHVERWISAARPRSRYFRDLPLAIADFILAGEVAPLARDGLVLERARWKATIAEDPAPSARPFSLEVVPVPSPSLSVFRAEHAVHAGGDEAPQPMFYAVYRKPDASVTTRWSTPTLGRLLEGWAAGDRPAIDVVRAVLAEEGRAPDAAFVEEMTSFLSTLLEEGALQ